MATVNLGRIKPVFRGAYSGSTAYVIDDIVTHGNESFICIQAHGAGTQATSVTAYWTKLAAKGTDGTDVGTTITTQGDILYRDGSGLQRLAKPASDKFLQNTSGGVLSWADAGGGKLLQVVNVSSNTNAATSNTSWTDTGISLAITPSATSSKVMVMVNGTIAGKATTYSAGCAVMRGTTPIGGGSNGRYANGACVDQWQGTANDYHKSHWSFNFLDTPNTTSATTYKIVFASGYTNGDGGYAYFNRNQADDDHFDDLATITLMEIGA